MIVPFVDLHAQYQSIKEEIDGAIRKILEKTAFIGGDIVDQFEEQFASFQQVRHSVSCANGTDAIEIALEALGIGPGDEVLVPSYTWVSTASAVSRVGAKPIFIDVDPTYYTMDTQNLESHITTATRAIIPVHFYGLPANMPEIMSVAQRHSLFVIEDCAQAHGAKIDDTLVGNFGHIATFSFYPGKNLGGYGDGGCIVSNNADLADRCRVIARLGQKGKHNHVAIGRNSRLDTLQAAILGAKLPHLNDWTEARRSHAKLYKELLEGCGAVLPAEPEGFRHVYHVFMVQVDNRDKVRENLTEKGIHTQLHYPKPITQLTPYHTAQKFPVSDEMAKRMISLPMYAELPGDHLEYVADQLKKML